MKIETTQNNGLVTDLHITADTIADAERLTEILFSLGHRIGKYVLPRPNMTLSEIIEFDKGNRP
jgi:hypothetical protein